ncbi:LLM class flavin-dependent oxidoreductase [Gulosibacter chungangensis]|uniref:LLM class flavin-dependent oxidoreductase n=1 Tax=Gulosibacter chungangensis TaxID=979746 RepID=UPI001788741E|nr:LLM class flavin-dependent oxidoreductase [Gulosibacter chungangensis]
MADSRRTCSYTRIELDRAIHSAQLLESSAFEKTIVVNASFALDPFVLGATIAQHTSTLQTIIALRPTTIEPIAAAKAYATIDQIAGGRTQAHLIAGRDQDTAREGDLSSKDARYRRMGEFIEVMRRAWTAEENFDHEGEFYRLCDYSPRVKAASGDAIPVSVGGSSEAAYRIGVEHADTFGLFAEPFADIQEQLTRLDALATSVGRTEPLDLMLDVRLIIAPTDDLAWEKAHRILNVTVAHRAGGRSGGAVEKSADVSDAAASQRILRIGEREELHDRVLWTRLAQATGAFGSSAVLVGSYERVAQALAQYYRMGFTTLSLRGYEGITDVVEQGQYLLPRVRELTAGASASV